MVKIDKEFLDKVMKRGFDSITKGKSLDLEDPDEIGKYIFWTPCYGR